MAVEVGRRELEAAGSPVSHHEEEATLKEEGTEPIQWGTQGEMAECLQRSSSGACAPETAAPTLVNTVCLYESSLLSFSL